LSLFWHINMKRQNTRKKTIQLLAKLGEAHGASGREGLIRRIFRDELHENLRTDKTGNIICEKRGKVKSPRIMLAAHMDEVGFVVQNITKSGLIRFAALGSWWPHTLLAQRVRILTREGIEIIGVIGAKPPHLLGMDERKNLLSIDQMFIDVGAENEDEVKGRFGIQLGDSIVPESSFVSMHNPDFLLCKAFDNRVGVALAIQAIHEIREVDHPNTVYCVGTVQEEVGVRGAQTAVFSLDPDLAIVLEGAPADDLPGFLEDERQGILGGGVQIRLLDPTAIMNHQFTQYVIDLAEEYDILYQVAVRKSGGTDAKSIHLHGVGVPTIVLGVPARYIHTHNSIIHINDYLNTLNLVLRLLQRLDKNTVNEFTSFKD